MREILQIICLVISFLIATASVLLGGTFIGKQYISGYCKRRLVAIGGIFLAGLIAFFPFIFFDIKMFLFGVGLTIFVTILGLGHYYVFICPPHKK